MVCVCVMQDKNIQGGGGGSLKSFGTVLLICICYPFISVEKWAECG